MNSKKTAMAKNTKQVQPAQALPPRTIESGEALDGEITNAKAANRGRAAIIKPAPSMEIAGRGASKLSRLEGLLRRPKGATLAQLAQALGWQKHSVRGAMSGALKKRGLGVISEERKGERFYRIAN